VRLAGLLLERPAAELASAAKVHDRPDAVAGGPGDIARQRLRRAPQLVADLMPVRIDEPDEAVVGHDHAQPGAQAPALAGERLAPALDPLLAAAVFAGEREQIRGTEEHEAERGQGSGRMRADHTDLKPARQEGGAAGGRQRSTT
jgi:hypothetical protein